MTAESGLPSKAWNIRGSILTFIIPASGGCNLACPFCFIDQRFESDLVDRLQIADYARFIGDIAARKSVAAICIQGVEPLLPASFPFAHAILAAGRGLGIPTALVTNGTYLDHWIDELSELAPDRLSVSLDAANAERHDRQRRTEGAFVSTVRGLKAAAGALPVGSELVVTSVLIPKRRAQLDAMPALLKEIGVKRWVVTALQKVRADRPGGPVGERENILADLRILSDRARRAGVDFKVDDEFDGLASANGRDEDEFEKNRIRRLVNPDGVYRLVPDGRCSKGSDILKPLTDDTPRWNPKTMDAGAFLATL